MHSAFSAGCTAPRFPTASGSLFGYFLKKKKLLLHCSCKYLSGGEKSPSQIKKTAFGLVQETIKYNLMKALSSGVIF